MHKNLLKNKNIKKFKHQMILNIFYCF